MNPIQVGVVMGSSSDWDTMQHAVAILQQFGIAFEAQVVSAHRMPDDMLRFAEAAAERGLKASALRKAPQGAPLILRHPVHQGIHDGPRSARVGVVDQGHQHIALPTVAMHIARQGVGVTQ